MYTLYVHHSYSLHIKRFTSLDAAQKFYAKLKLNKRFLVTIESSKLDGPIVLQQPTNNK
jgi:hypothetical protein